MSCVKEFLNSLVPLISLLLVLWASFVYNFIFCFNIVGNTKKKIIFWIVHNFLFVMVLWSKLAAICKAPSLVPNDYRVTNVEHNKLTEADDNERHNILMKVIQRKNLLIYTCTSSGTIRYCIHCRHIKPDRAHHCSSCEICVLKMDHHCPWLNNCVSFSNYKQFLLLLFYTTLYCSFYVASTLEYFIGYFHNPKNEFLHIFVGFILVTLCDIVFLVLLIYHIDLVSKNETTIESLREIAFCDGNMTFDMGCRENFKQIFGENIWLWCFPIFTARGNGHTFHVIHRVLR